MRPILVLILAATAAGVASAPVLAQSVDRYGGGASYPVPGPAQQAVPTAPERVLTWPGKTVPTAAPPQASGYAYPRYVQAQPDYGARLQPPPYAQDRAAPAAYYPPPPQGYGPQPYPQRRMQPPMRPTTSYPSSYRAQPYYAPAPGAPAPAPGSTATAPSGVYPPNTVPPQLAYPMAVPPQMGAPLVGPQQPVSIYAPPQGPRTSAPQTPAPRASATQVPQPQAEQTELNGSTGLSGQGRPNPTDPRQDQRVALNTAPAPVQTARLYSLHREFGLTPDPTPAPTPEGQTVELVSPIDSGGAPNPDADDRPATKRITDSNGKTVTAQLRGSSSTSVDN